MTVAAAIKCRVANVAMDGRDDVVIIYRYSVGITCLQQPFRLSPIYAVAIFATISI